MKVADLKVKDHFALCASAQFNKCAEEICEDLLNNVFAQIAHKANGGWVNLNQPSLLFVLLNDDLR